MLQLGSQARTVKWDAAGVTLKLVPLDDATDARFTAETVERLTNDDGKVVDVKRDVAAYAQKVGRHCIQGWDGVTDAEGQPVACTPERIDEFMLIAPAQKFVFARVRGLSLHLMDEVNAAKKG